MDGSRFDDLSRRLAVGASRRTALKGATAALLGAIGLRSRAEAQVSVTQCNNVRCRNNPERCNDGCVCCVFANGNNRCLPPGKCRLGTEICPEGEVVDPVRGCVPDGCVEGTACGDGFVCLDGACVDDSGTCGAPTPQGCLGGGDNSCCEGCSCTTSVEGARFCYQIVDPCPTQLCDGSDECPDGQLCQADGTGACGQVCFPVCGISGGAGIASLGAGSDPNATP